MANDKKMTANNNNVACENDFDTGPLSKMKIVTQKAAVCTAFLTMFQHRMQLSALKKQKNRRKVMKSSNYCFETPGMRSYQHHIRTDSSQSG